ncbi:hypothetical protein GGG16DRAFT_42837 [Schizophyllum commune]
MAGPHREISMGQMRRDDIGPVRRDELGPGRRDEMGGGAYAVAGPSGLRAHGSMEEGKKDKKRKDLSGKLGKEMSDRRDDGRAFAETTTALAAASATLATRPADHPLYRLRLLPYSLERSAALSALDFEEKHALDCVRAAYSDERARVEGEWRAGRERVAARMREGIAERRRRAREEKESEGAAGEGAGARVDVTRKLRRGGTGADTPDGAAGGATPGAQRDAGITAGPFRDPLSLSIDEIPSPFALALVSGAPAGGAAAAASAKGKGKRGAGGAGNRMALGQAVVHLVGCKEQDIEQDLGEIRRASKRRRQAVMSGHNVISFDASFVLSVHHLPSGYSGFSRQLQALARLSGVNRRRRAENMEADPSGDHDALCALLGDVPEILVAVFLDHVLPPSPVDIDLLVKKLSGKTSARAKGDCQSPSSASHFTSKCAYKEGDPEKKAIYAIKDNWLEAGHALEFDVYNDIIKAVHEHDWSQYPAPPEHPDDLDETRWQQPELKSPIDPRHGEVGLDRTRFFVPILAGRVLIYLAGLIVLHQVGYCHHDMSPFNILELDGQGVLADFEYVTQSSQLQARRGARMGTANFMAVEVMLGAHLIPKRVHAKSAASLRELAKNRQKGIQRSDPWKYSPVHDLESVWWIALWLLGRHTSETPPLQSDCQPGKHKSLYTQLFTGTMNASQRQRFLTDEVEVETRLFTALPPDWMERMHYGILMARNELMLAYQEKDAFEIPNQRLWYVVEGILCHAGRELTGEFVPFTF